jgi:hypothetical protein
MITPMIVSALLLLLVGFVVLYESVKHASIGYEDEFGFHTGTDVQRGPCIPTDPIVGLQVTAAPSKKFARAQRKRVLEDNVVAEQGSAAPFQL